ncbi:MAG: hypothetical protein ABH871_07690 [Pseudomonadota bacterium]
MKEKNCFIEAEEKTVEWEKQLFVERQETVTVLPPKAGLPSGLDKYLNDGILHQPLIRRKSCLTNDWAHINMARAERPMGSMNLQMKQSECVFCKGNEDKTPRCVTTGGDYMRVGESSWTLRVFPNLYPWLINHLNIVQTSDHKISFSELDEKEEFEAWCVAAKLAGEIEQQGSFPMLFRNHGWGSSIAHFHWQVGALPYIPNHIQEEMTVSKAFRDKWDINIFDALIKAEKAKGLRWIGEDEHTAVIAAFAPRTAFETWLICKAPITSISQCSSDQLSSLCTNLNTLLQRLYSQHNIDTMNIIFHQLPATKDHSHYRLHIEIMPFKHLGGAERGFGEYAIEVTPESVAASLRA